MQYGRFFTPRLHKQHGSFGDNNAVCHCQSNQRMAALWLGIVLALSLTTHVIVGKKAINLIL